MASHGAERSAPDSLPIVCVGIGAALFAIPGVPGLLASSERATRNGGAHDRIGRHFRAHGRRTEASTRRDRPWRCVGNQPGGCSCIAMPLIHCSTRPFWVIGCSVSAWRPRCSLRPLLPPRIQCWRATSNSARRNREKRTKPGLLSLPRPDSTMASPSRSSCAQSRSARRAGPESPGFWSWWQRGDVAAFGRDGHRRGGRLRNRLARLPCAEPGKAVAHWAMASWRSGSPASRLRPVRDGARLRFLAVFVAALALRAAERSHRYHEKLHDFAEQVERLLMMVLLILFGGAITSGSLFRALTWEAVAFRSARSVRGTSAFRLDQPCPRRLPRNRARGDQLLRDPRDRLRLLPRLCARQSGTFEIRRPFVEHARVSSVLRLDTAAWGDGHPCDASDRPSACQRRNHAQSRSRTKGRPSEFIATTTYDPTELSLPRVFVVLPPSYRKVAARALCHDRCSDPERSLPAARDTTASAFGGATRLRCGASGFQPRMASMTKNPIT